MPAHCVRFDEFFPADRDRVFAFFADHERFGSMWAGKTTRVRESTEGKDPNGRGSVRRIAAGALSFEETITRFEPPQLIEYRITRGSPLRNHLGRISFTGVPGGTRVLYTIEFDSRIPLLGGIIARGLKTAFARGKHKVMLDLGDAG